MVEHFAARLTKAILITNDVVVDLLKRHILMKNYWN